MAGQTAEIAPADKKTLRSARRDGDGRIDSADRRFDYVEEIGGRFGRARFGRENRQRRVYARISRRKKTGEWLWSKREKPSASKPKR